MIYSRIHLIGSRFRLLAVAGSGPSVEKWRFVDITNSDGCSHPHGRRTADVTRLRKFLLAPNSKKKRKNSLDFVFFFVFVRELVNCGCRHHRERGPLWRLEHVWSPTHTVLYLGFRGWIIGLPPPLTPPSQHPRARVSRWGLSRRRRRRSIRARRGEERKDPAQGKTAWRGGGESLVLTAYRLPTGFSLSLSIFIYIFARVLSSFPS